MTQQAGVRTEALDEAVSATAQLRREDMRRLADAGFRSIINKRPDFEGGPAQPLGADLQQAAHDAGLGMRRDGPWPPTERSAE